MKVSTELKNLIKDEFQKKRDDVKKDYNSFMNQYIENAKHIIESDPDFKQFVELANKLYEKYSNMEFIGVSSTIENASTLKAATAFYRSYSSGIGNTEFGEKLNELNVAERNLLIKLTYEKDIDKIREMLSDYGIEI